MTRIWVHEDKAFDKYCPFRAKVFDFEDKMPKEKLEVCIGSSCMAWGRKDEYSDYGACLLIPPMED